MEWMSLGAMLTLTGVLCVVLAGAIVWRPWMARRRAAEVRRAVRLFRIQREMLEAKFFDLASAQGKPRGLRWLECDWQSDVTFARDVASGLLTAFVAVQISFEAIEGGEMEDVAAVGDVRSAAAVFHYRKGRWGTGGRALFNMDPRDALVRLHGQFEPVALEAGL